MTDRTSTPGWVRKDEGYRPDRLLRFRAAWHEARCVECRVTWRSWFQRIIGDQKGMTP